jgi:hypothetical protein
MFTSQKGKWWIDVILFAGFILAFFLDLTGVGLHQWIGVLIGGLAVYHLAAHWSWVEAVTERFFGRTSGRARLYYLIDIALLSGFGLMTATGLMISTWLNLELESELVSELVSELASYAAWVEVHIWVSIATLALTLVKLGLHWRWIAAAGRRSIKLPETAPRQAAVVSTPATRQGMSRGDFLKVMGVTGAAGALALVSAAKGLGSSDSAETQEEAGQEAAAVQPSGSSGCSVLCPRGCSYPGHCRRYQDSNGNGRCDLGECL